MNLFLHYSLALLEDHSSDVSEYHEGEATEKTVRRIWAEFTGSNEQFAEGETFSNLGGNSILAMIMIGKVRDAIGVDVTPSDYFNHITFDTFMEMLRSKSKVQAASEKLIRNEEDRYEPFALITPAIK